MANDSRANFRSTAIGFSNAVNRLTLFVCVICILSMLTISFVGFIYMVTTGEALSWTYSLARLFVPWIGMLSITVAFHAGEHVAMSMMQRLLPKQLAKAMQYAAFAAVAVFGGFCCGSVGSSSSARRSILWCLTRYKYTVAGLRHVSL